MASRAKETIIKETTYCDPLLCHMELTHPLFKVLSFTILTINKKSRPKRQLFIYISLKKLVQVLKIYGNRKQLKLMVLNSIDKNMFHNGSICGGCITSEIFIPKKPFKVTHSSQRTYRYSQSFTFTYNLREISSSGTSHSTWGIFRVQKVFEFYSSFVAY